MKETNQTEDTSAKENVQEVHYYHSNQPWGIRLFDALTLITIGIVLLLNTTGVVGFKIWFEMFRFWPLILVSIGVSIIFGLSYWGKVFGKGIGYIIFLLMLFLAGLNSITNSSLIDGLRSSLPNFLLTPMFVFSNEGNNQTKETIYSINDYPLVENLTLDLKFGKGDLLINDPTTDNDILQVKSTYSTSDGEYNISNSVKNTTDMSVNFNSDDVVSSNMLFNVSAPFYDMKLSSLLKKVDIYLKLGAGKAVLDFKNLLINNLKVENGVGETNATFTVNSLPVLFDINVGAGEMNITLPKEVGYKLNYKVGIGEVSINNVNKGQGLGSNGTILSDNYNLSTNKTEINLNVGIGSFNLTYK